MWYAYGDKKKLLKLISSNDPFDILNVQPSDTFYPNIIKRNVNKDDFVFLWFNKPQIGVSLPDIISISKEKQRDFLAWASTFISYFKPFTAFCRVIDHDNTINIFKKIDKEFRKKIENVCVGIIIGESETHYFNKDIKRITPIAIKSTYSYVLSRANLFYLINQDYNEIKYRFRKLHDITKQPKKKLNLDLIEDVWFFLDLLIKEKKPYELKNSKYDDFYDIYSACYEIFNYGKMKDDTWFKLTNNIYELRNFNKEINQTQEKSIDIFEKSSSLLLNNSKLNERKIVFLLGFLISKVYKGTMKYTKELYSLIKRFPNVILWYGFLAGLYRNLEIFDYCNGLGWRILRDLYQYNEVFCNNFGDIYFDELEVLLNVEKPQKYFNMESHMYLNVEVYPNIYSVVIWPEINKGQISFFEDEKETKIDENLIQKLDDTISKTQEYFQKLKSQCYSKDLKKTRPKNKKK